MTPRQSQCTKRWGTMRGEMWRRGNKPSLSTSQRLAAQKCLTKSAHTSSFTDNNSIWLSSRPCSVCLKWHDLRENPCLWEAVSIQLDKWDLDDTATSAVWEMETDVFLPFKWAPIYSTSTRLFVFFFWFIVQEQAFKNNNFLFNNSKITRDELSIYTW